MARPAHIARFLLAFLPAALLPATPAGAHIVGAFGDFLAGIQDENTLQRLQQQIEETTREIAVLTPQVEALGKEYEGREKASVAKLLFYKSIWLDTYADMILSSEELIDVLAGQRLIEHKVDQDVASINTLYLKFMQLQVTRDALVGHRQVLSMIRSNLQAREELLDRYGGMKPDRLAKIAAVIWQNSAAAYVDEYLIADAKVVNRDPGVFFTRRTGQSAFLLSQDALNGIKDEKLDELPADGTTGQQISGKLEYNIRADHVYVHFVNRDAKQEHVDLILIGTVERDAERKIALQFEAGYMNGIVLPAEYMAQLGGFKLDYAKLNPGSTGFDAEQVGGAIVVQPVEGAGE